MRGAPTPVIVTVTCNAKLNLFLKVYGKRPDGFHDIISIMQSIGLADTLVMEDSDNEGIHIECTNPNVPVDESNLVWKAAKLLLKETGRRAGGLRVRIEKNIPMMGGLAGGSTDGAGALVGLNRLWKLGLEDEQIIRLAARIGSDAPFCVVGGTSLVRGRGDVVEPLPEGIAHGSLAGGAFMLVLPPVQIETKRAYDILDESRHTQVRKWEALTSEYTEILDGWVRAIADGAIPAMFHNDFADPVFDSNPGLGAVYNNLRNTAGHAVLSGSGSSMFAWFDRAADAIEARDRYMPVAGEMVIVVYPVDEGVSIEG